MRSSPGFEEPHPLCCRLDIQGVCFDKTQNIIDTLHSCADPSEKMARQKQADMVAELTGRLNDA